MIPEYILFFVIGLAVGSIATALVMIKAGDVTITTPCNHFYVSNGPWSLRKHCIYCGLEATDKSKWRD